MQNKNRAAYKDCYPPQARENHFYTKQFFGKNMLIVDVADHYLGIKSVLGTKHFPTAKPETVI